MGVTIRSKNDGELLRLEVLVKAEAWTVAVAKRRGAKRAKVALVWKSASSSTVCGSTAATSASWVANG
jgi:hypothetical protein